MKTKSALLEKLQKNTSIKEADILSDSMLFSQKDIIVTDIPIMNVALSGSLDGGLTPGLTLMAGPSKHFKTSLALVCARAFINKYDDGIILFYDSEFGTPQSYFESFGIPTDRVFHSPITDIEKLKFDIMQQMAGLNRGDHVMIIVDSIGNLASKKEIEDALEQKSAADFTRAKQFKSLFRMVTPHLTLKNIPMVCVAHTYKTMEMFSKDVVSGGTGQYYSADNILIIGRQQDKDGDELAGYNFILNVDKSRFVKEKSKIPITVSFERGISQWSGLLDLALEFGTVVKPKIGWYTRPLVPNDKNWRIKETNSPDFWNPILKTTNFSEMITAKYRLGEGDMINTAVDEDDGE